MNKLLSMSLSVGSVILFIILCLLFSGCAEQVQIKDAELCGDMGDLGATCFHTLTQVKRDIPKVEWDQYRVGKICEDATVIADFKTEILKLCNLSEACTYEERKAVAIVAARAARIKRVARR